MNSPSDTASGAGSSASNILSDSTVLAADHASIHHSVIHAVIEAVKPAVATAVATQIHASLQEPWFALIIEACVAKYMCPSSSGGSAESGSSAMSGSSLNSGSGGEVVSAPAVAHISAGTSHAEIDALCIWDMPCPVCGQQPFANEKVFYEHIVAIGKNRFKSSHIKLKCVMRSTHPQHQLLLQPFLNPAQSYFDSVLDFVNAMRALMTPGSKRVYRPGGTGNIERVRVFINSLLQKRVMAASGNFDDMWLDVGGAAPGNGN